MEKRHGKGWQEKANSGEDERYVLKGEATEYVNK